MEDTDCVLCHFEQAQLFVGKFISYLDIDDELEIWCQYICLFFKSNIMTNDLLET